MVEISQFVRLSTKDLLKSCEVKLQKDPKLVHVITSIQKKIITLRAVPLKNSRAGKTPSPEKNPEVGGSVEK